MTEKAKNPKRVAAGKANRAKRGPITEVTRAKHRSAIKQIQPWLFSTGPQTPEGKRRSAANVRMRTAFIDGTMQRRMDEFLRQLAEQHQQSQQNIFNESGEQNESNG